MAVWSYVASNTLNVAVRNKQYMYSRSAYYTFNVRTYTVWRVARSREYIYANLQCVKYGTYFVYQIIYITVNYFYCKYQSGVYIDMPL